MFKSQKAYAKINLTLEVIGRRDDGYHEIASVVQAIDLCDVLHFRAGDSVSLSCNVPELVSPNNLVIQAVRLLQAEGRGWGGVAISLEKGIRLASGLGGGSSDAAVALRAVSEIWGMGVGLEGLEEMAARLGSDVPFFLCGGTTALVEGRGERVTRLPSLAKSFVVLVRPPVYIGDKTRRMYAGVDFSHYTRGEHTERVAELISDGERVNSESCYNVFDDMAFDWLPELAEHRLRFMAAGAAHVHVAGSGPTLFTLVDSRAEGEEMCRFLEKEKVEVYLAETL